MKVVALDFETANASPASACSLGIAIYEEGEIVDNFEWYFKPHFRYNFFTNTHIHGIAKQDVEDEYEFVYYYDELSQILKDALIVAHNAMFDIGVLNAECDIYGLDHFLNPYIDTVTVSRKVYPELYNHKLNTVCEYLSIDLSHHNGKSDAMGCLMILLKAMSAYDIYEPEEFIKRIRLPLKHNM
ncbi:MAG: 3'-5' exonuclease [Erysipelotrichaceae bacterium]|nr:3'-5' exonuclease [Erysipelotrichaceae bacterium]MBQ2232840.1 3'-5' exonuclease [Erysipelotrichaceae bacterium]MBQ3994812.1 3'-5' exonuclease [Erysipelotrichaceae bacterium]MBQ4020712.1 3'-5' exonuclease [Erysipelotrichaceae bacterium]